MPEERKRERQGEKEREERKKEEGGGRQRERRRRERDIKTETERERGGGDKKTPFCSGKYNSFWLQPYDKHREKPMNMIDNSDRWPKLPNKAFVTADSRLILSTHYVLNDSQLKRLSPNCLNISDYKNHTPIDLQ